MSIKAALADASDDMRLAIKRILVDDGSFELVGEASNFVAAMQIVTDVKPEVLLLDLHLPSERSFTPEIIKSQLAIVPHTVAISVSNDQDAKALAASYGAEVLLDKMNLYGDMVPTIVRCCNQKNGTAKTPTAPRNHRGIRATKRVA
jgi:chemotaxis response regulator CheB